MRSLNKIVLLGDAGTGKTALLAQWADGAICNTQAPTIGAAYKMVPFQSNDGEIYNLHIWDTAGQETYRSTSPIYCRDSKAAMIVFDLTSPSSFNNIGVWIEILQNEGDIPFVIVGNKNDLVRQRKVAKDEAHAAATKLGVEYFETSATTGDMVREAFLEVAKLAIGSEQKQFMTTSVDVRNGDNDGSSCC